MCPDADALATVFRTVFAALVFRTAYGADFLHPAVPDDTSSDGLIALTLPLLHPRSV